MTPVYITLIGTVWAFFVHANVRWRFGPLEQLVSTPHFHNWHHTNDEHRDRNYEALVPWVDRLYGTYNAQTRFYRKTRVEGKGVCVSVVVGGQRTIKQHTIHKHR